MSAMTQFQGQRILIAEDNPTNQQLVLAFLKRANLIGEAVDNGRDAVERAKSGDFQLVLMDIQMPIMDGLEAARTIREWERGRTGRLPILALTAHGLPESRERVKTCGMDELVAKPVEAEVLYREIDRLLSPRTQVSS